VQIQYPGVAESIHSDIDNLSRLISFANVLPKGLYLDHTMAAAKQELSMECDYAQEAMAQKRFASLLARHPDHPYVSVPSVVDEWSTRRVLTTEMVHGGMPIDKCHALDQDSRNR
jgi:aarF domain-containing kinase